MESVTTIRETARLAVENQAADYCRKSHERNYEKLHVRRDGRVHWTEFADQHSDIIDDGADDFRAVPSLATVGTGSCGCNCDYCNAVYNATEEEYAQMEGRPYNRAEKYDTREEAIDAAVTDSDYSDVEATLLAAFDEIPVGYFDDEAEETE